MMHDNEWHGTVSRCSVAAYCNIVLDSALSAISSISACITRWRGMELTSWQKSLSWCNGSTLWDNQVVHLVLHVLNTLDWVEGVHNALCLVEDVQGTLCSMDPSDEVSPNQCARLEGRPVKICKDENKTCALECRSFCGCAQLFTITHSTCRTRLRE